MSTRSSGEPPATTEPEQTTRPVVKRTAPGRAQPVKRVGPAPSESESAAKDSEGEIAGEIVQLCFVRHADAGDPGAWPGDDAVRPLSAKGRRQARRLASLLADVGFRPHVLLTSPKVRAEQTAQILARGMHVEAQEDARLGGPFGIDLVRDLLVEHGAARRVLLVGHDPEFSAVVSALVGASIEVRKGAFVRIDLAGRSPRPGAGTLRWLLPPGLLAD